MGARRGRARKSGERYASGKVKPDADIRSVVWAQPHRRHLPIEYNERGAIKTDHRLDQFACDPLGRLRLANVISGVEYDAGQKYADVTRRYYAVRGVPDATRKPEPGSGADLSDDEARRRLDAWAGAEKALSALHPECRRLVVKVSVSLRDPEGVEISYLLVGLRALVAYWGLTGGEKQGITENHHQKL